MQRHCTALPSPLVAPQFAGDTGDERSDLRDVGGSVVGGDRQHEVETSMV